MGEGTRRIAAPALAILAALAVLATVVFGYANHALFDADEFAERATAALDDEAVAAEVATRVTDDLVLHAQADLIAARPLIESVIDGLVSGGVFQSVMRSAVRDVHRAVFEQDANTATLTLGDVGAVLRGALEALRPQLADEIPGGIDLEVTPIEPPSWLAELARVAEGAGMLELILLALAIVLAAAALLVSVDRRRTVLLFSLALVIAGVAAVVALGVVNALLLRQIDNPGTRDAADAIWQAYLGDLVTSLYLLTACGAVIAAAASSLLRPVDAFAPLRRAFELLAAAPQSRRLRLLRAVLLIVVGVLIILERDTFIDLVALLIGLYAAYAGASELMRLSLADRPDQVSADRREGRRALIAAGVAALVIVIAGSIFIGAGGIEESPAAIETSGCNGSEELCDQRLDEALFPSTHNAMSAATNPGWLSAQQDKGFADQLRDGIRGLFIDAHYGTPTESGRIKTDLSDLDGPERQVYEQELGPEALDAALRIRDRVVNSPESGPRAVYLCHRFCELGALPIDDAFRQYRDFLAANPNEVLAIVIEDYVAPEDIDAAVRESGLIDYVYTGPLGAPLPTLQQIIDSGGRAILIAENDAGGAAIPYYHPAYETLVQETPYSFKNPAALTDAEQLPASCRAEPRARRRAAVSDQPLGRHLAGAEALERGQGQRSRRAAGADSRVRA